MRPANAATAGCRVLDAEKVAEETMLAMLNPQQQQKVSEGMRHFSDTLK